VTARPGLERPLALTSPKRPKPWAHSTGPKMPTSEQKVSRNADARGTLSEAAR
jgi:hypothetical protein